MNYGQQSNISAMRKYVYDLIRATTQKTAGQKQYAPKSYIDWDELDMLFMPIVIEATALVLSGGLERVEHYESIRIDPRIVAGAKRRQAAHSDARGGRYGGKYISGQAIRKRLRKNEKENILSPTASYIGTVTERCAAMPPDILCIDL